MLKDSVLYGGAAAFKKCFALITFPLLTRYFSVDEYGVISAFSVFGLLLVVLAVFGQDSAIARFYYEEDSTRQRQQLISESFCIQIAVLGLIGLIVWHSAGRMAEQIHSSQFGGAIVRLIALQIPGMLLVSFSQNLLKWTFKRREFLIVSLGTTVVNMAILVIGIKYFAIGLVGVFKISLGVQLFFGLLGLWFVRSWIVIPRRLTFASRLLRFAIPLGIICSIGALLPNIERAMVTRLFGEGQLGLYSGGAAIAVLMNLFVTAFQTAWGPFSLAIHKEQDAIGTYRWVLKGLVTLICVGALLLALASGWLIETLASRKFAGAQVIVFPLAMGLAIEGISWVTEIGISLSKRSYLKLYSYSCFLVVTPLLMYLLAKAFGVVGIASGLMMGQAVRAVITGGLAQKAYYLNWPYREVITMVVVTMILGSTGAVLGAEGREVASRLVFSASILVILLGGVFGVFDGEERSQLLSFCRNVVCKVSRISKPEI